jgi:hypothetical protein
MKWELYDFVTGQTRTVNGFRVAFESEHAATQVMRSLCKRDTSGAFWAVRYR